MVIHKMRCGSGMAKFLFQNHGLQEHADLIKAGNYTLAAYILLGYRLSIDNGKAIETYTYRKFKGEIHCFHRIYRKEYSK
jgi:hypothetical protein